MDGRHVHEDRVRLPRRCPGRLRLHDERVCPALVRDAGDLAGVEREAGRQLAAHERPRGSDRVGERRDIRLSDVRGAGRERRRADDRRRARARRADGERRAQHDRSQDGKQRASRLHRRSPPRFQPLQCYASKPSTLRGRVNPPSTGPVVWRADPLEVLGDAVAGLDGERREGQVALTEAVAAAMSGGHHLVAEAPTGSGKSLAYLAPAVASGLRVVVATSTIALQSQLVGKDLPALRLHAALPFTYALLKGRSNYLCRAKLRTANEPDALFEQPVGLGFSEHLRQLRAFAAETETGDRSELEDDIPDSTWAAVSCTSVECPGKANCPDGAECFAEHARDVALGASILVVNHALVLRAPRVGGQGAARPRPRDHRRGPLLPGERDERVRGGDRRRRDHARRGHAAARRRRAGDGRRAHRIGQAARQAHRAPRGCDRRHGRRRARRRARCRRRSGSRPRTASSTSRRTTRSARRSSRSAASRCCAGSPRRTTTTSCGSMPSAATSGSGSRRSSPAG